MKRIVLLCCWQPPAGLCVLQEEPGALLCLGEQHLKKHHSSKNNRPKGCCFTNIPALSTEASGSFIPLLRDLDTDHTTAGVREQRCCWAQLSSWDPHNSSCAAWGLLQEATWQPKVWRHVHHMDAEAGFVMTHFSSTLA